MFFFYDSDVLATTIDHRLGVLSVLFVIWTLHFYMFDSSTKKAPLGLLLKSLSSYAINGQLKMADTNNISKNHQTVYQQKIDDFDDILAASTFFKSIKLVCFITSKKFKGKTSLLEHQPRLLGSRVRFPAGAFAIFPFLSKLHFHFPFLLSLSSSFPFPSPFDLSLALKTRSLHLSHEEDLLVPRLKSSPSSFKNLLPKSDSEAQFYNKFELQQRVFKSNHAALRLVQYLFTKVFLLLLWCFYTQVGDHVLNLFVCCAPFSVRNFLAVTKIAWNVSEPHCAVTFLAWRCRWWLAEHF